MAPKQARLAWAYAELQPAVNTLRLCNRYGHGDHAAISRLPLELITAIESYIIEDKRQELRIEWAASFKCLEGRCWPLDHFTPEEFFYGYRARGGLKMSRRRAEQEAICPSLPRLLPELYPQEIQDLNEELDLDYHDDWLEGYRGKTKWVVLHRQVKERWESETREPTKPSCGVFFDHVALFKPHIGLDIHVSHPYLDTNKREYSNRFGEQYSQDNDCKLQTTVACLTLPISTTIDKELHRSCVLHSEMGTPSPLAVQAQISGSSLARFTRALRILGFHTLAEDIIKEETMLACMDDTKRDSDAVVISRQTDEARDERSETGDGIVANVEACNFQWREGEVWTEPQILVQANDETTAQ